MNIVLWVKGNDEVFCVVPEHLKTGSTEQEWKTALDNMGLEERDTEVEGQHDGQNEDA